MRTHLDLNKLKKKKYKHWARPRIIGVRNTPDTAVFTVWQMCVCTCVPGKFLPFSWPRPVADKSQRCLRPPTSHGALLTWASRSRSLPTSPAYAAASPPARIRWCLSTLHTLRTQTPASVDKLHVPLCSLPPGRGAGCTPGQCNPSIGLCASHSSAPQLHGIWYLPVLELREEQLQGVDRN